MAGYCKSQGTFVGVNWDSFSNIPVLGKKFFDHIYANNICPTLIQDPPKPEKITSKGWGFADQAPKPISSQDLFGLVRRVRNNLFHGGKYFDDNSKRDAAIISEAIATLLLALEWHNDVNFFFEGRA